MLSVLLLPGLLQMLAMLVDEFYFHRKRGLPRWERIGHPLDTLTTALCYGWALGTSAAAPHALGVYVGLAAFSCLFITKDEFVHARLCDPKESWLHSVLFVLHPVVLLAFAVLWQLGTYSWLLQAQLALTLTFFMYQLVYWSPMGQRQL
jgi:hypothetical protein